MQARRVAVDHVVVVSSRRYPRWATAHHETTRWFAERYNTVTTQSTVPNKSGVWRGCCCIVEVALWRRGGDDDDAIAVKRAPEPHRCRNTHKLTRATHARTHARKQARTHTQARTHIHCSILNHCTQPLELQAAGAYTPALPTTTHATPMPRACSTSFGASVYTPALAAHWLYPSAPWQINPLRETPLPPCGPRSRGSGSIGSSSLSCDSGAHISRGGTTW